MMSGASAQFNIFGPSSTTEKSSGATENVPLPRPAPKNRDSEIVRPPGSIAGAPAAPAAPRPAQAMPMVPPAATANPIPSLIAPPDRNLRIDTSAGGFTPEQRAAATKVSTYLSSLQTLTGNFVQVGPDGSRTSGEFFIQKPGKVRFEYDPPSRIAIVADGSSVIVRDTKLATQDLFPLSQTPLRYLLSDRIDLLRDTNIVKITADDTFISVTIEEKQPVIGTSRLMLMVGARDFQLKQWTVTDPQGYDTTVAVHNLDTAKRIDPGMFRIDYTRYDRSNTTGN
jgi:outer membrane lipoprotein-sorting protein